MTRFGTPLACASIFLVAACALPKQHKIDPESSALMPDVLARKLVTVKFGESALDRIEAKGLGLESCRSKHKSGRIAEINRVAYFAAPPVFSSASGPILRVVFEHSFWQTCGTIRDVSVRDLSEAQQLLTALRTLGAPASELLSMGD